MTRICNNPLKRYGPYGDSDWACERPKWHAGRHRFRNYTWGRIPHLWRVRRLWRTRKTNQRLLSYRKPGQKLPGLLRYRPVLFPSRFDPLPPRRSVGVGSQ